WGAGCGRHPSDICIRSWRKLTLGGHHSLHLQPRLLRFVASVKQLLTELPDLIFHTGCRFVESTNHFLNLCFDLFHLLVELFFESCFESCPEFVDRGQQYPGGTRPNLL